MKRIVIIPIMVITILFLTGCNERTSEYDSSLLNSYYIYVDKETCVEYFVSDGSYNTGDFTPRYNADGTLKTNKNCLNSRED